MTDNKKPSRDQGRQRPGQQDQRTSQSGPARGRGPARPSTPPARMAFGDDGNWNSEPVGNANAGAGRGQPRDQQGGGRTDRAASQGRSQGERSQSGSVQSGSAHSGAAQPRTGRQEQQRGRSGSRGGAGRTETSAPAPSSAPAQASAVQIAGPAEWPRLLGERQPTPVQEQAIPQLLAGRDVVVTARTGSGKTLAFLIPAVARGIGMQTPGGMNPEVLIVSPTRELAVQIRDVALGLGMPAGRITGGISPRETKREATAKGVVSGTPGRLKDLIDKRELSLTNVKYVVLDEADELLSLGFLKDVEWIVGQARSQAATRKTDIQVALASATFPNEVRSVAARVLRNPVRIDIEPPAALAPLAPGEVAAAGEGRAEHVAADTTRPELLAHAAAEIRQVLAEPGGCVVVFCRTKALAKKRATDLGQMLPGEQVVALQGNMDQRKREAVMALLREGKARVLVATDIAGRGIDLPEVRLVIHADVATTSEDHVHRSGRTARAGRGGRNLVLLIPEQRGRWATVRRGLPEQLHPPRTPQEHSIDKDIQEKQGVGSGNGVDSGGRSGQRAGRAQDGYGQGRSQQGTGGRSSSGSGSRAEGNGPRRTGRR
ncbi:DEAD/DEAH box helicase [Deinococcus sp.]|uniref:DEAD/DEAH box helicase n=1 Tax=Deinococcus sp. TaxID=47478 RepID=UPI0025B8FBF3|nr:DEAD/DEAH box helicase [Deinococcus sp.]